MLAAVSATNGHLRSNPQRAVRYGFEAAANGGRFTSATSHWPFRRRSAPIVAGGHGGPRRRCTSGLRWRARPEGGAHDGVPNQAAPPASNDYVPTIASPLSSPSLAPMASSGAASPAVRGGPVVVMIYMSLTRTPHARFSERLQRWPTMCRSRWRISTEPTTRR